MAMTRVSTGLGWAVTLAAVAAIAGALLGGPWLWLHYVCKPLATVLILAQVVRAAPLPSARYRWALMLGLVCSLAGDVFLMLPQDLFVPGLLAFLLAHLCFMTAFWPGAGWPSRVGALLLYAVIAAANLALLLPQVPSALRMPVLAYVCVLVMMAALAAARAWDLRRVAGVSRAAAAAALGGGLFVLSDSLLAWNRFGGGLPLASLLVLATYYAALWCIARSVEQSSR